MGENSTAQRLTFTAAAPTPNQNAEGVTVYEAKANGVTYRVLGTLVDPMTSRRRVFRAYRVTGKTGHTLHPAGPGGPLSARAAAYAAAEADLVEVLRDRDRATVENDLAGITASQLTPAPTCPAGTACSGAAFPGHPAHPATEPEWPKPICPDAEAGKAHAAHRIEGTWRDRCPGVEPAAPTGCPAGPSRSGAAFPGHPAHGGTAASGRKLRGPAHAHLDAPCTDACYEPETRSLNSLMGQPDAAPGEPSAWTVFHDTMSAAIRAADAAVRAAATPEADPATEDNVGELVDRIVRRAQYEALKAMLGVLAGWIEGARSNCMADGHRGEAVPCGESFHVEDIRNMINDAARELGTVEPWKADR